MGSSKNNASYTPGSLITSTCLNYITHSINDGYNRGSASSNPTPTLTKTTYDNMLAIGANVAPALSNSVPPTYLPYDPANVWGRTSATAVSTCTAEKYGTKQLVNPSPPAPANAGYDIPSNVDSGQEASWYPFNSSNPNPGITQYGWVRCHALQAWNEFNYNGDTITQTAAVGSLVVGAFYTIVVVGTTDFTALGAASNATGVRFTATATGTVNAGSFVSGKSYTITAVGTTNWGAIGYSGSPVVGGTFIATGSGSGTGTAAQGNGTATYDTVVDQTPAYNQFLGSFMTVNSFLSDANQTIHTVSNANTFLDGVYSNMNDLTSADITGVSLAATDFGTDLENLGKVIDLSQIEKFGMPSNLLINIGKAGAMTQDLGLALLSAGMSKDDISAIASGIIPNWSKQLEQQIFGAFLIITGDNLNHILAPLQCKTIGLTNLADLLNPQKMFPTSYASLTVPVYNGTLGLPTNSKTYYLIYQNGGLNTTLNNQTIKDYVGTIIPKGTPPTYSNTNSPENFADLPKGFGSYLDGVIPSDWATAAGAFSYTMRQIRNIESLDIQKFAKVAKSIENMSDLPLTAGTSKPTNQLAIDSSASICSLGSGKSGSYTMSDFFGSMSGLPYPWQLLQQSITDLASANLTNLYQQQFLAVTWEQATVDVLYAPTGLGTYRVTGFTITNPGGGYGRGAAPAPQITLSNGGTATVTIGTDPAKAGSLGTGTYGRVTDITLTSHGPDLSSIPTATIESAPITNAGGTNTTTGTAGWPSTINTVVQNYTDQANSEITSIANANPLMLAKLNTYWNILGSQLAREQRARYTFLGPVSVPKEAFVNPYPSTCYTFLDALTELSQDTSPHMAAQTLEAISDMNSVGGQSLVGKMREERNQARIQQLGTEQDNNIDSNMSVVDQRTLIANGIVAGATPESGIASPNGNIYTIPAWPTTVAPSGYYVPGTGFQSTQSTQPGDITPILNGSVNPVVNTAVPTGPVNAPASPIDGIVIIAPPAEYNPSNLSPNLDTTYTDSTMLPATLSIPNAIDQVTTCNCDCQLN